MQRQVSNSNRKLGKRYRKQKKLSRLKRAHRKRFKEVTRR